MVSPSRLKPSWRPDRLRPLVEPQSPAPSRFANVVAGLEVDCGRIRIKADPDRFAAGGQRLKLVAQHPTHHQDPAIALAEMLLRMNGDRALANLRLIVAGKLPVLFLGHVPPEFAVEF